MGSCHHYLQSHLQRVMSSSVLLNSRLACQPVLHMTLSTNNSSHTPTPYKPWYSTSGGTTPHYSSSVRILAPNALKTKSNKACPKIHQVINDIYDIMLHDFFIFMSSYLIISLQQISLLFTHVFTLNKSLLGNNYL